MPTRQEQIFAATKHIGGKRRTASTPANAKPSVKGVLDSSFKGECVPTILKSCSFKSGSNIHTIEKPVIKSIYKGRKQQLAFIVTGDESIAQESDVLNSLPGDLLAELGMGKKEEKTPEVVQEVEE